jgi:exosome complex RNA-binding protein Rrp4
MDISTVYLIFMTISLFFIETSSERNKRTLLNDPDMLNARLDNMQREMQSLQLELQDFKTQRTNQGTIFDNKTILSQILLSGNYEFNITCYFTGANYIRWGSKDCPVLNGTSTVYSGK